MNMKEYNLPESTGIEFEDRIIEKCGCVCIERWGAGAFSISTVSEDKLKGTDFFVLGVPIDVTLNIKNKTHTTVSDFTIDLGFVKVTFGVRFGNGRVKFETPVLVLGFETLLDRKDVMKLTNLISKSELIEILNKGMDFYFETVAE